MGLVKALLVWLIGAVTLHGDIKQSHKDVSGYKYACSEFRGMDE